MEPFIGQLMLVPYNFAPKGWAFCQGQLMSISQNSALFSLLGTTYGGDGITTFALPDLRGRSAIGAGQGPGLQNYTLGEKAGNESVTLIATQMPAHNHTLNVHSGEATATDPSGAVLANAQQNAYSPTPNGVAAPNAIGVAGGNQPHENRPPFLVLNWVIALQGIYPSRN